MIVKSNEGTFLQFKSKTCSSRLYLVYMTEILMQRQQGPVAVNQWLGSMNRIKIQENTPKTRVIEKGTG